MAIGAYNQGIGHIFDAMLLSKRLGKDPRKWRNVRAALQKLQHKRYHTSSVFGFTRGAEGAQYVDRIRFYYYVLKGWTLLPGLELKQLAPFRLSLLDLGLVR
jgi:membrane-bound lytic murein transglycosylase F